MTFQRCWREWLTGRLLDLWLVHDNYRLLDGGPGEPQLAEYRIAEDARIATDAPIRANGYTPFIATTPGLKLMTMVNDQNGRSTYGFADVPMKKVSETESLSEKQAGLHWRIGPRKAITPYTRTHKAYRSATGPYEQHVGGAPHFRFG